MHRQPEILGIEPRDDITDRDTIADIDDAGDNLAGDTEAEISLVACPHHADKVPRAIRALEADALNLHRTFGLQRGCRIGFAAGEDEQGGEADKRTRRADEATGQGHGSLL